MRCFSLLLVLILCGCAPQSGALVSAHTDLSGHFTRQVVISDHPRHVLYGHLLITRRGGDTLRTLVISHRQDGVHRLGFVEAWSGGVQLPFSRAGALDGCSHGHCLNSHAGMIFLSEALFAHARAHGLQARLISGTENITIEVSASLFEAAAA